MYKITNYSDNSKILFNLYFFYFYFFSETNLSYVTGYVKCCRKHLFLYDKQLECYEGDLTVVLDSFVHPTKQRNGVARGLFDFLLQSENVRPELLAMDNPSAALISFFGKAFGLDKPIWQNTNIVVFQKLFDSLQKNGKKIFKHSLWLFY